MRKGVCLMVVVLFVAGAAAQDSTAQKPSRPRALVYALEALGGLGGCGGCGAVAVGAFAVAWGAGWSGEQAAGNAAGALLVASALAIPAATGTGVAGVGGMLGEQGSTGWAIGGAYLGAAVGYALLGLVGVPIIYSTTDPGGDYVGPILVATGVSALAIPVGAVIGYNTGRPKSAKLGSVEDRLQLPGFALTATRLPDRSVEHGVKVQLAGLRF